MLIKIFTLGPIGTHCYLIGCPETRHAAIIDAPKGALNAVFQEIQGQHLSVEMILLTHSHWDHIADIAEFKKAWQVPVYIHLLDAKNLSSPGLDGLDLPFPIEGVKPDIYVQQGDHLQLGKLQLEVIETPGHTPGGVCFWFAKEKVLFSGDTLFKGGIGKLSLPTGNSAAMHSSLKKLASLPAETKVYPGHGPSTTIGIELLNNHRDLFPT